MTPATTRPLIRLNTANIMTTSPADLKNMPDLELFLTLNELRLTSARIGNVPSANESMVSPPFRKLPVVSVYNCIDWVNPQGRKNVAIPTRSGVRI